MQWRYLVVGGLRLLSTLTVAAAVPQGGQAAKAPGANDAPPSRDASSSAPVTGAGGTTQKQSESVFGAGCRWDPTINNIEEVTFQFRTGQAPPSTWFSNVDAPAAAKAAHTEVDQKLQRRQADPVVPAPQEADAASAGTRKRRKGGHHAHVGADGALDASYHTRLIDVLTFRARYGSFGSSLNSAGCALPAFSERLAQLEAQEQQIVNNYTRMHKPIAGQDDVPSAMFFWAGISNYDPKVRSDLIQTVVFYGDGCAANPRQGLCVYAAEYSNFRYSPEDHMCMGSNMPVFYPIDANMTVHYRTQNGFRTQEAWIDGKMVSYLRSAGDQVMNSFVITQECKSCTWPLSEQVYENIRIKFSTPERGFDLLQRCTGGARTDAPARSLEDGRVWVIDRVTVPSGKHVTSTGDVMAQQQERVHGTDNEGEAPAPGSVPPFVSANAANTGPVRSDPATVQHNAPTNDGRPAVHARIVRLNAQADSAAPARVAAAVQPVGGTTQP